MAGRRTEVLDIREIILRLRRRERHRQIARDLAIDRKTVRRYATWADCAGFLGDRCMPTPEEVEGALKTLDESQAGPPVVPSTVEPFRRQVAEMRAEGVPVAAICQRLARRHGYGGSYSAVLRFVRRLEPVDKDVVVRVEVSPGSQAQVDFGFLGLLRNHRTTEIRKAWAFVLTLSHSRHMYARIVFDQSEATWLDCHRRAFEFLGGVPETIVPDNLKAAIVKASFEGDAEAQRSYRGLAEHYNFRISPCVPRKPQHKGKVERGGVAYLKGNFWKGDEFRDDEHANEELLRWLIEVAGQRKHGTTRRKPLEVFRTVEANHLQPLPSTPYELTVWKKAKLHRDCHLVFDYSYYSAPFRYAGKDLWIRATPRTVSVYAEHELVATHVRATEQGTRQTSRMHLPPEKLPGLEATRESVIARAREIGESTLEYVQRLLGERPMDRLRSADGVVRLAKRYGAHRLEAACRRALACGDYTRHSIKRILQKDLDTQPLPAEVDVAVPAMPSASRFARPWTDFCFLPY